MSWSDVRSGADLLARDRALVSGRRFGLVTNHTGVTATLTDTTSAFLSAGLPLAALFAPEHGLGGSAQAGRSESPDREPESGLPVYDTYGRSQQELEEQLVVSDVDTLLFDLQDIGTRFYTYLWTMHDLMVAAARSELRFVVLDRPNPLGGLEVEGPLLDQEFASFVGRAPVPIRHGLTMGELARQLNGTVLPQLCGRPLELQVLRAAGWSRSVEWRDTGLPWVMPSVNIPTPDSALVYPGTGLFEGTNASEGRGTTRPFELIGAPYVDRRWGRELNRCALPGVRFRDVSFRPTFHKYADRTVHGVQLHVTEPARFRPVRTAVVMIALLHTLYPDEFEWRVAPAGAERTTHRYPIDLLWGSDRLRRRIDAGEDPVELLTGTPGSVPDWVDPGVLLYP